MVYNKGIHVKTTFDLHAANHSLHTPVFGVADLGRLYATIVPSQMELYKQKQKGNIPT